MPDTSGPMNCPVDGNMLVMSERSGIEIDYCPSCRGVWLDRGELDKIIERNAASSPPPQQQAEPPPRQNQWSDAPPQQQQQHRQGYGHKPHKRSKSFLENLFD